MRVVGLGMIVHVATNGSLASILRRLVDLDFEPHVVRTYAYLSTYVALFLLVGLVLARKGSKWADRLRLAGGRMTTPDSITARPAQDPSMHAGEIAATVLRVAACITVIWTIVLLSVLAGELVAGRHSESASQRNLSVLVLYALRLLVALAVLAEAPRIASWAGMGEASPRTTWTPAAAVRLGTTIVGLWVVFLACEPGAELFRGVTGIGVPRRPDSFDRYLVPDVRIEAVTTALYVAFGVLLIVGPAGRFRRRAILPLPPPEPSSPPAS